MVVENYVNAWTGTLGNYALQLADQALIKSGAAEDPNKPTGTLADIPFVKAFVIRYPSARAQSITDFYEKHTSIQKQIDTIKFLAKAGDYKNMEKELMLQQDSMQITSLEGIKEALSKQTSYIRMVYKNEEMTPDEKRQQIDEVYKQMIEEAQWGNQLFKQLEEGPLNAN